MRKALKELVENTVVLEYELPHSSKAIEKATYSTRNDHCCSTAGDTAVAEIIYNSIVEYAFNEHELTKQDYQKLHAIALQTKIRYDANKKLEEQIKYGFFGEVLLYCTLFITHKAKPLISRGYFYSPTSKSETTGYDSYHLLQNGENLELWFGEVKFHAKHTSGIKDALENIEKGLSDDFLKGNLLVLTDKTQNFNIKDTKLEQVINEWRDNPSIEIVTVAKKHEIKLVYPILILFDEHKSGFDHSIQEAIKYINDYKPKKTFSPSIAVSVFFILTTVKNTNQLKREVLEWIHSKKPLLP